jgi:hypothetical protein
MSQTESIAPKMKTLFFTADKKPVAKLLKYLMEKDFQ